MSDDNISEGLHMMHQFNLNFVQVIDTKDDSYFSKTEILEIITTIKENYIHLIWFKLLYSFGMTLFELVNLKVKDIDFVSAKINIHSSKKLMSRSLDIPEALLRELRIQCERKFPESYLFHGRGGKLHTRTIQKALEKVESKLNIQITISKIRKSIAVHLLQNGWDYRAIGEFLGHAHYRATRNLLGPNSKKYRKSIAPLDEILNP
ncbi:MAG: tyrosine-type recombinase/integrase [Leptospiraceae bacterium]|nr:tyrosine-type recombinase/integrase [Leptospiraceae bacterium]